ncbi:MAG: adenylate/guanylate cyclase domain-containing protein [Chloroflexota bacterium]
MATSAPSDPAVPERLAAARQAIANHMWQQAFDAFVAADAERPLEGADLESLSDAAFFTANIDVRERALERAFTSHLAAGDPIRAAAIALGLAIDLAFQGRSSIASGWTRRAARLLEGTSGTYAHGYLALAMSGAARAQGRLDEALALAEDAVRIASSSTDPNLQAIALLSLGGLKIGAGDTAGGLALMEEATAAAVNDELTPYLTGVTYCSMISACRDLNDYERASEWTEATERWCERSAVSGFPGVCRVHRAEIVALGGDWPRAAQELERATQELARYRAVPPLSDGFYAIGEIRLRMGDLDRAEAALREAHANGHSPQPALALIRLARGDARGAAIAIDREVAETPDVWARARLLPAQVDIAIAVGHVPVARNAAEELSRTLATHDTPAAAARAHDAAGRVALADGEPAAAVRELRAAIAAWRGVGAPYEIARDRLVLASALEMVGDTDGADLEYASARSEFERLGARLDVAQADAAAAVVAERRAGHASARKTFLFTDIVGSTALAELLGDEAWEQLLRWHDETLRAILTRAGGDVVNSTGDGFFVAFDDAGAALDAAMAIQRRLAEHRRTSGAAIAIRIGLHTADASRRGNDYSGVGVNLAARVAAVGAASEIVATEAAMSAAGRVTDEGFREVELRGISAPVGIATVRWS